MYDAPGRVADNAFVLHRATPFDDMLKLCASPVRASLAKCARLSVGVSHRLGRDSGPLCALGTVSRSITTFATRRLRHTSATIMRSAQTQPRISPSSVSELCSYAPLPPPPLTSLRASKFRQGLYLGGSVAAPRLHSAVSVAAVAMAVPRIVLKGKGVSHRDSFSMLGHVLPLRVAPSS